MNDNFKYPYTSRTQPLNREEAYKEVLRSNDQFRVISDRCEANNKLKASIENTEAFNVEEAIL